MESCGECIFLKGGHCNMRNVPRGVKDALCFWFISHEGHEELKAHYEGMTCHA